MPLRSRLGLPGEPLYLMDGTAFVFRGFYAYQNMARSDGFPTNALFITTRIVLKLLREERPGQFAFIMDGRGPNFRHELYPQYKAQRGATPEPLVAQLEPVRRTLAALGIPVVVSRGCEADDCIASLAARFRAERPVVIIGADKDLKQCLAENVVLWDPASRDERLTTLADFTRGEGMAPSSWPDFQALIGDSSDNIPGVPGIGPKTAQELFRSFATLEEIRDRFASVPPKIRKKLDGRLDSAFLYRKLTTLSLDACAELGPEDLAVRPMNVAEAMRVLEEFELRSLVRELAAMEKAGLAGATRPAREAPESPPVPAGKKGESSAAGPQGSLFDLAPPPAAPDLPRIGRPADLPPLSGPFLALVPHEPGLALACGEDEWLYAGPLADLAAFLAARDVSLVVPDLKALYNRDAAFAGLPVARWFDLSLAAYLLSPEERDYSWPSLVRRWSEQNAGGHDPGRPGRFALGLASLFADRLAAAQQSGLMRDLEMPLIPVLYDMERAGVRIDKNAFSSFLDEVQRELDRLDAEIHRLAGGPFNIRSSQQLGDVLFVRLGLPRAGKTKGGLASTAQEALEKLTGKHPVIDALLEYRKLEKLRSTYLEPLPRLADADGRIHTTFNLLATATGRLSSSNPNLQNIPVRGEFGQRMRACFVPAPGRLLVSADYSQVELRILAHLADDPILIDAFRKGEDIHSRTASLLFDAGRDAVTPEQRRQAKTINFGLVYGMGPQKLGQELGIPVKEAKAFIERYFERLQGLRVFYDSVEREAREHGYVTTLAGRRRYIPDIGSQNEQLRSQARRQAINARVQGSAADVIKIAMLRAASDPELRQLDARLLLQIHDELVLEVPEEAARAAGERLAAVMAAVQPGGAPLRTPLLVDWGVGGNWAAAH